MVPAGAVWLVGDDIITKHPGPNAFGKARHCHAVRSPHSHTAYCWTQKWVVVSVLVTWPFATRPWALPVLAALYRPPEWNQLHGMRHKTPAHMPRLLLARLMRWFPHRHFIFVGDSGYGARETARFCRQCGRHLPLVSKFYGDAALYEPPPLQTHTTLGTPPREWRETGLPPRAGGLDDAAHKTHRGMLGGYQQRHRPRDRHRALASPRAGSCRRALGARP